MELSKAIQERKSCRAFKPDPVSLETLRKIMGPALKAPSWANTQPWEFAVATGKPLKEIEEGFVARGIDETHSEVPRPFEFPEPFLGRVMALQPEDRKEMTPNEMKEWMNLNSRHYGAPACIYLLIRKNFYFQSGGINSWSLYDCGSCVQNLMLLAVEEGLATVAQAQAVIYPDIIRKTLGIPEDRLIALGIAIGYPDENAAGSAGRTSREPLDKVAKYHGF